MYRNVIVGVDGRQGGRDAAALSAVLTGPASALRGHPAEGVIVQETLPGTDAAKAGSFHALWRGEQGSPDYLNRLGHQMRAYEAAHNRSGDLLRGHGQLHGRMR
jgi:hypothetical protein